MRLSSLILTLLLALSFLSSCFFPNKGNVSTKEEIEKNIASTLQNDELEYDYAMQYLYFWGIENIDTQKFLWYEQIISQYYNYEGGLPEVLTHAKLTAEFFIENYYGKIDKKDKTAVTDALLASYAYVIDDPYTIYRVAEVFDDYYTDMSGKFGGIGVTIEYDHTEETIMVSSINIDSPAEAAGIKVGDFIVAVDGMRIEDIGYLNVANAVRGAIGSEVKITVLRDGAELELTAVRAIVVEKSVNYKLLENGLGYIQVTDFKANTDEQFCEAVLSLEGLGAKGIIFDMRNNPGGYLDTVCNMVSFVIEDDLPIVSYQIKGYEQTVIKSGGDIAPDDKNNEEYDHKITLPIAVICNEYTASAAEVFTAAIRDYRDMGLIDAVTVGTTTYKKGIMQSTFNHKDGSSITLTTAYYNPPCGENYHGTGVTPDVVAELSESIDTQYEAAISELEKLIKSK